MDSASNGNAWAAPDGSHTEPGFSPPPLAAPVEPSAAASVPGWSTPTPPGATANDVPPPPPADHGIAPGAVSYAMYKPGIIVLRPLGFGEILDGGIKALRHNPKVMLGLNALIVLVSQVALFGLGYDYFSTIFSLDVVELETFQIGSILAFFVGAILSSLILTATSAVTSVSVGRSIIGERIPVGDAWKAAWKRTPTVLVMTLLMLGVGIGAYFAIILLTVLLAALHPVLGIIAAVLSALVVLVGALGLGVKFGLAIPAAVLEQLGPIKALRRSWRLTQGRFWPIMGVLVVATLITGVIQNVLSVPIMVIIPLAAVLSPTATSVAFMVALVLSSFLGVLISVVFVGGITAILYTDQRMRREGFDLTLSRAAMERLQTP